MTKKKRNRNEIRQVVSAGPFAILPAAVCQSYNYGQLSKLAKALLLDLLGQLPSHRNGDLVIRMKVQSGWTSNDSLMKARDELMHYGFITLTRQGCRNRPSYYALSFMNIRTAKDIDVKQTENPTEEYKQRQPKFEPKRKQKAPEKTVSVIRQADSKSSDCTARRILNGGGRAN